MIRCISPACSLTNTGQRTTDQVMYHGYTLCCKTKSSIRQKNIVIDQCRSMSHFHKQILRHHAAFQIGCIRRTLVVMEQVLGNPCSLCFPVAPDTHGTVMNVIASISDINGCMHLDTCNLCTALFHHVVDVMDMVVFDHTEYTAHTTDDTTLFTVMNIISADNMTSYLFFQPAMILSAAYGITFHLCRAFDIFICKIMIIIRIQVFTYGNTCTFAVRDITVLDDPSFAPVRTDHTVLKCCRRRPGGCCLADGKAADCDITYPCFGREEAFTTNIDFYLFYIRIFPLEIGVNDCFIRFGILFGIPFVDRLFRNPAAWIHFSPKTLIQSYSFIHGATVQIYASGMFVCFCKIPVSVYCCCIWVIRTEHAVCHTAYPGAVLIFCPGFDLLRTGDHCPQRFYATIGDPGIFVSGMDRINIFTVDSRSYQDFVSRLCDLCSIVDFSERSLFGSVSITCSIYVYINFHVHNLHVLHIV